MFFIPIATIDELSDFINKYTWIYLMVSLFLAIINYIAKYFAPKKYHNLHKLLKKKAIKKLHDDII